MAANKMTWRTFWPGTKRKEITMKKYLLGAAFLGILAMTATGASAAVVCNDEGDCWKVKDKYDYPPDAHLQIYGDDWNGKATSIAGAIRERDAAIGVEAFGSVSRRHTPPIFGASPSRGGPL